MRNRLPPSWTTAVLADLLMAFESGSRPRGGVRGIHEGVPSIGGEHLNYDGTFDFSSVKYVPKEFAARMTKGRIQPNDILVVKDGATTGKTAFVDSSFPFRDAVVNEHVFICRPKLQIEPRFLFRFLTSKTGQELILENFKGSAQGGINQTFARNTEVPLAPLNEQRRIVAKLEKLLANVDACQQRLVKIPVLLKRFRQSVLAAACSGRLTADWRKRARVANKQPVPIADADLPEIPDSWRWVKLPETGEMNRGRSRHRPRNEPKLFEGPYPFIQTGDIAQSGGRITSHRQTYSKAGLAQSRLWPVGTICITIAANIAESAILTYPACFPDSIVGIIANPDVCVAEYVEYFIRVAKADLATFAPATAQKNINIAILNKLAVPLPPLTEQKEIVRRVEALFALADQVESRYTRSKTHADTLTQSMLAKAFRGELVSEAMRNVSV